jgi:hemerythrin-like domain-containing protein
MAIPQYQIDEWFTPPKHENGQDEAIEEILASAKSFVEVINKHIYDGDEKSNAIQNVRQAVLAAELWIRWKWPAAKIKLM